ncbi:MAG: metalloregulator ArsR/SmtB family transcription factor [Christensenellaceae bacterium]|jgi:ArsR family transcriptional regulator|nr:metalloregulator ArsR/SmtB family transcription factor [Christensenellaceae bacterium]
MGTKTQISCDCGAIHNEVIDRVKGKMPNNGEFYALSNLYKMFADNTRARILWALSCEEMCVCDLAVLLNVTKSAISHQLQSFRLLNLVKYEKRGKEVYYSLADEHVNVLLKYGLEHIKE